MTFLSRGRIHHADSTVECPDCSRRFTTGTIVAEYHGHIGIRFKSKQTGQWGHVRVPVEQVVWSDERLETLP
jgi:hypothetical protein